MKKRHEQKLVALSLVLLLVLNMPVILIFDKHDQILGIPILYFAIFISWLISIIISFIVLKRHYE